MMTKSKPSFGLVIQALLVITDPYTKEVRDIEKKAMSVGLKLLHSKVRHLGTEENLKILTRIYLDLEKKIDTRFSTTVKDIVVEEGQVKGVILADDERIDTDYVLLAVGREGSQWLTNLFEKLNVEMTQNQVDIGVRVECPNMVMEEINKNLYEGKFIYKASTGSTVRTFCSNPGGHVVMENYQGVVKIILNISKIRFNRSFLSRCGYG